MKQKFNVITSSCIPLPLENVDTDQIIPARFLITSSDYNGYDPDNSSRLGGNNWGTNRQFFTYPRARTFTFGLNVAF